MKKFLLLLMLMALPAFAEQGPKEWVWGSSTGGAEPSHLFATGNRWQFVPTNTSWYHTMKEYDNKESGTDDWAWISSPSLGWQYTGPTREFTVTYVGSWWCFGVTTDAGYSTGYRITVNRNAGDPGDWLGEIAAGPVMLAPSGCAFGYCQVLNPLGIATGTVVLNSTDVIRTESSCTVSGGTPLIGGAMSCDATSCTGRNGEKDSQLTAVGQ